ncbi:winged helix-turn-helix domain-containing protein [Paenibacillus doosanensis]|uniref:Helix-turn-helix domain-containing protein n=1 Tax=Paenibacillus konkukensis TaxID=2020716 RepID=A0ABY4RRL6_9BACL|nr:MULTISPECIES: winged helix-turn-helix domain-containing protein [Paenibacillus]MCS7463285.1 winged helix-turn-helix domain-containing protein [Paenibacillus doosanensis]UQZ85179.1 hypothetical protein SK3146_04462 [Paenibacillus konkukensis]
MNMSNCSGCGKLHLQPANVLCADCFKLHVADGHKIKAYLQANPGATVMDLARETGLSLKKVSEWVKR